MCLKVSRLFGSSPQMWMRLQAAYDLKKAKQNKASLITDGSCLGNPG